MTFSQRRGPEPILDRGWGKPKETIEASGEISFVQIIERALMMPAPPPPEHLGEIMTIEKFRAIEAGKAIKGGD